mgnify:CR=1 FL=1
MTHFQKLVILAIIGLIQLSSCSQPKPSEEALLVDEPQLDPAVVETTPKFIAPSPHPYLNSFAQLISGSTDSFPGIEIDSSLIHDYRKRMAEEMDKLNENRLLPLRHWYADILNYDDRVDTLLVFYPFSGGDFLHLYNVYPNASEYIMMAIEPVGSIPSLNDSEKEFLPEYLESIEFNLRDIFKRSYFITKNMQDDIKENPNIDGMLPSILWGVGVTGHQVVSMLGAKLDSTGKILTTEIDSSSEKALKDGVQIVFYDQKTEKVKTVTYLRCDISDKGISKNPSLKTFLDSIRPNNAFVKAASYLLHYSSFSDIRTCLLTKSENLLQDDTGIPFNYFNTDGKKVKLYGDYVLPVSDFNKSLFQKDLVVKFRDTNYYQGPLPFSMGYHWGSNQQNQMVVMKTAPTGALDEDEPLLADNSQESTPTVEVTIKNEPYNANPPTEAKKKKPSKNEAIASSKDSTPKPVAVKIEPKTQEGDVTLSNEKEVDWTDDKIIYRVQIHASSKAISTDSHVFKKLEVRRYQESGLFKFTVGEFSDYQHADKLADEMQSKGFNGAFVVAFKKGKRISKSEFQKLIGSIWGYNTILLPETCYLPNVENDLKIISSLKPLETNKCLVG